MGFLKKIFRASNKVHNVLQAPANKLMKAVGADQISAVREAHSFTNKMARGVDSAVKTGSKDKRKQTFADAAAMPKDEEENDKLGSSSISTRGVSRKNKHIVSY